MYRLSGGFLHMCTRIHFNHLYGTGQHLYRQCISQRLGPGSKPNSADQTCRNPHLRPRSPHRPYCTKLPHRLLPRQSHQLRNHAKSANDSGPKPMIKQEKVIGMLLMRMKASCPPGSPKILLALRGPKVLPSVYHSRTRSRRMQRRDDHRCRNLRSSA